MNHIATFGSWSRKPLTVIYGHDSRRGLQIEPWTKGIDSGCIRGDKLSAFVIEGGKEKITTQVVSVNCKKPKH